MHILALHDGGASGEITLNRSHDNMMGEITLNRLPEDTSEGITLNRLPEEVAFKICQFGQITPGMSTIYLTQELSNLDANFNLCLIHELGQALHNVPLDLARLFTTPELPIHLLITCGMTNVVISRLTRDVTEDDRAHIDRLGNCVHIGRYYVIYPTCSDIPEYNDNESMLRSLLLIYPKLNVGEMNALVRRISRYRDELGSDLRSLVELTMYSDVVSISWKSYDDRYGYYVDIHSRNRKTANIVCRLLGDDLRADCVNKGIYRIEVSALHLYRYNKIAAIIGNVRTEFMRGFKDICLGE